MHINETTIGSTVSSVSLDNLFSSSYKNYKIIVNINTASTENLIRIRLRTSGSSNTTGNYVYQMFSSSFTSTSLSVQTRTVDGNTFMNSISYNSNGGALIYDIFNPFATDRTFLSGVGTRDNLGSYFNGGFTTTTSFDGIEFLAPSGTISGGNIRVYGYKD